MEDFIAWLVCVIISFVLGRVAVQIDMKFSDGELIEAVDSYWTIGIIVAVTLIPVINVIASLAVFVVSLIIAIGNSDSYVDGEKILKKIFLIREKKQKLK